MRISVPALLICILPMVFPTGADGQSVRIERGNVVYVSAGGAARRLTSTELDSSAVLAPDGRTVAFVRRTPGEATAAGAGGDRELTELWRVGVDGAGARRLVRGRAGDSPPTVLAGLHSPAFSPDGRRVYFLSGAWATSDAVHAVEVATGRVAYVAPGNSLEVVPCGEYAGHLIVAQHRYFLAGDRTTGTGC